MWPVPPPPPPRLSTGKTTDVFKTSAARDIPEETCFSIVLSDRTLDLATTNKTQRDLWVHAFRFALRNVKAGGSIGLLPKRVEQQVDKASDDKLADMLKLSTRQFGTGLKPNAKLVEAVDLVFSLLLLLLHFYNAHLSF